MIFLIIIYLVDLQFTYPILIAMMRSIKHTTSLQSINFFAQSSAKLVFFKIYQLKIHSHILYSPKNSDHFIQQNFPHTIPVPNSTKLKLKKNNPPFGALTKRKPFFSTSLYVHWLDTCQFEKRMDQNVKLERVRNSKLLARTREQTSLRATAAFGISVETGGKSHLNLSGGFSLLNAYEVCSACFCIFLLISFWNLLSDDYWG